jgi:hypothetical protein
LLIEHQSHPRFARSFTAATDTRVSSVATISSQN